MDIKIEALQNALPNYFQVLDNPLSRRVALAALAVLLAVVAVACGVKYLFSKKREEEQTPHLPPEIWQRIFTHTPIETRSADVLATTLTCRGMADTFLPWFNTYRRALEADNVLSQIPTNWLGHELILLGHERLDRRMREGVSLEYFAGTFTIFKGNSYFASYNFPVSSKEFKLYFYITKEGALHARIDASEDLSPLFIETLRHELEVREILYTPQTGANCLRQICRKMILATKLRRGRPLTSFETKLIDRFTGDFLLEKNLLQMPLQQA